ncbi:MAG: 4Fe-4S dicluster domain-containing protein [Bacillota bacterium]|jgi:2-oxoglutarate ferredoxin oxidoreductase subunit delta
MDKRVTFNEDHCKSCELCLNVCPKKIIKLRSELNRQGYHPAFVSDEDQEQCISCALCARMCPDAVIEVRKP